LNFNTRRLLRTLFWFGVGGFGGVVGCSQTTNDQIKDAQSCLNSATQSSALTCYNKVSGLSSSSASYIRCASLLMYQNVVSTTNLTAIANMTSGSGVTTVMANLAFTVNGGGSVANTADVTQAKDATTQCTASGSPGMQILASLSSVATVANNLVSGTFSASTIQTNAATIVATLPQAPALLSMAYTQNCSGTVSSSNASYCTQYSAAITAAGAGNTSAIATYFLSHIN